jgi:hypothetical protein
VFREAADRHANALRSAGEAHLASIPTTEDWRRFLEAARAILALDGETKRLSRGRRSALLNAPIENADQEAAIIGALEPALTRVLDSWRKSAGFDPESIEARLLMLRALMARLTAGGLNGAQDKNTLREATLQLRELGSLGEFSSRAKDGAKAHAWPKEGSEADKARAQRLRSEAQKLRKNPANLRSKRSRARVLNSLMGKEKWSTPDALIEYARRKGIEI